jgi:hypothetical protein
MLHTVKEGMQLSIKTFAVLANFPQQVGLKDMAVNGNSILVLFSIYTIDLVLPPGSLQYKRR